jgi:hypothetical protein
MYDFQALLRASPKQGLALLFASVIVENIQFDLASMRLPQQFKYGRLQLPELANQ